MPFKIFTFPFDPALEGFDSTALDQFCLDKEVHELIPQFFLREGRPYWTVWVRYRVAGEPRVAPRGGLQTTPTLPADWGERERLLYQRLKTWRGEEAERSGDPHFVICRNRDLVAIVQALPRSKAELQAIAGFGPKKVAKYGADILGIVQAFLTEQAPSDAKS